MEKLPGDESAVESIVDYWELLSQVFFHVEVHSGPGGGLWFRISPVKADFWEALKRKSASRISKMVEWTHYNPKDSTLTIDFGRPRARVRDKVIDEISRRFAQREDA